jgi:hypothetical protein
MSKSDTFENDFLKLILNATAITGLADNAASGTLTNLYLSLHTADPGETGSQTTNECTYTGYARVAVARTSAGWTITGNSAALTSLKAFANPTDATNLPQTASYWALGTASTGTGKILWSGSISPTIVISNTGVTPQLGTGTTITED